jgi:hypothetical protein
MNIIDFMKENSLDWQPSFCGKLENSMTGYRGAMIVEEGKALSETRKLPPKIQARQVILISDDSKVKFFACELESFNDLKPFVEKYKEFFDDSSLNVLYVTDLDGNGTFEYEGLKFTAFMLDESSVWNELLELADLEKGDMKKLSSEEKIEKLYDELLDNDIEEDKKSYDDMCKLMGESSKQLMGAV